jgi:hypothetical protein
MDQPLAGCSLFEWALGEMRFKGCFQEPSDDVELLNIEDYLALDKWERAGKTPITTEDRLAIDESLVRAAERRQQIWDVYREITGNQSPFVERIQSDLRQKVEDEQRQSVDTMKKEYETRIAEMQRDIDGKMASQLRDRLLQLAGFGPSNPDSGNE